MIERSEVQSLLDKWREKTTDFANNAKAFNSNKTGYYGRMAEAEKGVAEQIVNDLEALLLKKVKA